MNDLNQFSEIGLDVLGITLVVTILVFLIIRELVMWYWKINKRIKKQERQIELLEEILREIKKK
ncbi:hypothetical protein BN85314540 [Paracholeplasma brassicae]|uniref:Uncharacterized protein n=1 Tax=Acholeplasma brassicae TaxID=61635 RepID=U4KPZ7_9MOLU|nr:hypothetical protein [Paracholeplasma brassicae]CCV66475.1 hypothetical protein BN85314540 [Paracholeplasma brassicae]